MGKMKALFVLVLMTCFAAAINGHGNEEEGGTGWREGEQKFVMRESVGVVKTDAGEMRVSRVFGGRFLKNPMHIGFITVEPGSMLIPQYWDSSLVLFIRTGEARLGHIYKDDLAEKRLKTGDIYTIPAGSAFYLVNTAEGQRLHIICSIDISESLSGDRFQSFFIGGGTYPVPVLAGFGPRTLSTALNVSVGELSEMLTKQQKGPIIFLQDPGVPGAPSVWAEFLEMKKHEKLAHLKRIGHYAAADFKEDEEKEKQTWSWKKLVLSFFQNKKSKERKRTSKGPDSYNIYDRKPDFRNDYGWSIALDESDYAPLRYSNIGVYLVNLTAGSMMAPHINPMATEYGVVLTGSGTIQIVNPSGTLAMNAKVNQGDVFWIPRYFAFCQIASRTGPFEFFGFTSASRNNSPQFLAGANSILRTMLGPEIAASFGLSEQRLREILNAQNESVILPSTPVSPPQHQIW